MKRRHEAMLGALMLSCALSLTTGCATPPKPKVIQTASDRLANSDTSELETLQPRLMREAKQYEIQARRAYTQRDLERAKLYAYLAIQRYETAQNLVQRDSAQALAKKMEAANEDLAQEVDALQEEQREMQRYRQLEQRFSQVKGELSDVREQQQGAAAQARRLLLQARTRQAEALGAGASSTAPKEYAEARLLVESALEAYDAQLYEESTNSSKDALASFESLIEQAADSARAQREEEKKARARAEQARTQTLAQREEAQQAIDDVTDAQTAAIGARMPDEQPAAYEQGTFLLRTAERRLDNDDFEGAVKRAQEAQQLFLDGAKAAEENAVAEEGAQAGAAVASNAAASTPDADSGAVAQAIQRAEDARSEALVRGATTAELQRGDYALDLARQAASRNDTPRALQKAAEATSAYQSIRVTGTNQTMASPPSAGSPSLGANRSVASSSTLRSRSEEMIVELQMERAEALGAMKDESCPGTFREFEAVLELAQQRFDAGDYAQAFEFAVRASERLRKCDAPGAATSVSSAASTEASAPAPAERKPSPEERAQQARRNKAADALSQAQGDYAVLSVEAPEDARLRKPAALISASEKWFAQGDYEQSEQLATRAISSMEEIAQSLEQEEASREAVAAAREESAQQQRAQREAAAASERASAEETSASTDERLAQACSRVDSLLEQVRGAQLRASRKDLGEAQQERYRRGVRTLTRAKALRREEVCESAEILAEEALATFEEVAKRPSTQEQQTAQKEDGALPDAEELASQEEEQTGQEDPSEETQEERVTSSEQEKTSKSTSQEELGERAVSAASKEAEAQEEETPTEEYDPRAEARASEAIAKARVSRSRVQDASSDNVFITADSLLRQAERLERQGRYAKAEGMARQAVGAFESLDAESAVTDEQGRTVDSSWKPAYSKVLDALIRRDEVAPKIGEPEQATFERGVKNLKRSERAWQSDDFIAAARFADAAKEDFDEAFAAAKERRAEQEEAAEAEQAAEDKAQREKEAEAAAKAKAQREAKEAQQQKSARRQAEDAVREASIKKRMCDDKRCNLRDNSRLIRANETLSSAEKALSSQDYERAADLANNAMKLYEETLEQPRAFFIPNDVNRVTRAGDKLSLNPRVKFKTGGTDIIGESLASLDQLAKVLRANTDILAGVELVGYTDSRGNDAKNKELSRQRAAAVEQALIERGVPGALLSSTGRGEENPVADNSTARGRELNRRVEVLIEVKESK